MNNSFKRSFYSSLIAVLFVISNLVGIKYTNFSGLVLPVSFVTFPFIFLCILLLNNICNKKESSSAVLSAVFIQVFILLSYIIVGNLGTQNIIPDFANYVNVVFKVDEVYIITNLIAFMLSNYVLQYILEYFRIVGYRLIGVVISVLSALVLYGLITIPVINYGFGSEIIFEILMCHIIMSCIMTMLITVLYYILKDKEYPYEENKVLVNDNKEEGSKKIVDMPVEEVMEIANTKNDKKQVKKRNYQKNNEKKVKKSKKVVKK